MTNKEKYWLVKQAAHPSTKVVLGNVTPIVSGPTIGTATHPRYGKVHMMRHVNPLQVDLATAHPTTGKVTGNTETNMVRNLKDVKYTDTKSKPSATAIKKHEAKIKGPRSWGNVRPASPVSGSGTGVGGGRGSVPRGGGTRGVPIRAGKGGGGVAGLKGPVIHL